MEEYRKERQALIEARKVKNTVPDGELQKQEDDEKIVPKTFKEKWDNYWYHYKGVTLGGLFAAVVAFAFIWQMTHPTVYDCSFSVVTVFPFGSFQEELKEVLVSHMDDYTGDGEKNLELVVYSVVDPDDKEAVTDAQSVMAEQMKLMARLSTGEDYLFLVDELGYERVHDQMEMSFLDLSELYDSGHIEGDKYCLNGTKLLEEVGLKDWEEPLYLCIVDLSLYWGDTPVKEDVQEKYDASCAFLESLMAVG